MPPLGSFGIENMELDKANTAKLSPHPYNTYLTALHLQRPIGAYKPCDYIECTKPPYRPTQPNHALRDSFGLTNHLLDTGHNAPVTAPKKLATLLLKVASSKPHKSKL